MNQVPRMLSIGEFAKLAKLTPRQLRYYQELGILQPASVNPESGYRYYALTQRSTAELISLLRSVDMPLADIQDLLAEPTSARVQEAFARLRSQVEERLEHARELMARIDEFAQEATKMATEPAMYPFEAFSEESQTALKEAQRLAEETGDGYIGTQHLVAAIALGEGRAAAAMREGGVDSRAILATAVDDSHGAPIDVDRPLPTLPIKRLIFHAFERAGLDPTARPVPPKPLVQPEHLLLAVFDEPAAGADALGKLGLDAERLVKHLG